MFDSSWISAMKEFWICVCILLLLPGSIMDDWTWTYSGEKGPKNWVETCSERDVAQQSPINIIASSTDESVDGVPLIQFSPAYSVAINVTLYNADKFVKLSFPDSKPEATDNPNALYVTMKGVGVHYLDYIGFHWGSKYADGSEHKIDSESYSMEVQFIHKPSKPSQKASEFNLAILFKAGLYDNPKYSPITNELPRIKQPNTFIHFKLRRLRDILPKDLETFFYYEGTQTIPPCNPRVMWVVFKEVLPISEYQIHQLWSLLDANHRGMHIARRNVQQRINIKPVQYRNDPNNPNNPNNPKNNPYNSACVNSISIMCMGLSFAFWIILYNK